MRRFFTRMALALLFSPALISCSPEVIVTDTQVSVPTALATTTSEPPPTIEVPTPEIMPSTATPTVAVAPTPTVGPAADWDCVPFPPPTPEVVPTEIEPNSQANLQGIFLSEGRIAQDCRMYYRMMRFDGSSLVETVLVRSASLERPTGWLVPGENSANYIEVSSGEYTMDSGVVVIEISQRSWYFRSEDGYNVLDDYLSDITYTEYRGRFFGDKLIFDEYVYNGGSRNPGYIDEYKYELIAQP